ncbi:sensor histidine kinase [Glycomyces salinus]|uniref:sensor histidine kinase n=1 Tax=Glycomyces salinus TaxID=980294 RepID=UPI0018EE38AA|nr:histidine kinase [Glycomyces salinus]
MIDVNASADRQATAPPTLGERFDAALDRLGVRSPFARDSLLAVVVAAISFGLFWEMATLVPLESTDAQAGKLAVIGCVQALLLCLRRIRPTLCLAAVVVCQLAIVATAPEVMAHGLGPLVAAYTYATLSPVKVTIAAGAAATLAETLTATAIAWGQDAATATVYNHASSAAVAYAIAGFTGVYMAARRRHLALERQRTAEAIRAQRERAEAAVAAERTRIARELHDVAAHHLSGMVVQAAAVERLIGRDDAAAASGAAWIRSQGKATLENLRLVVGLLRDRDADDGNAPVPGLSALPSLIDEARGLGDRVEFERTGEALRLPPIADISLYRIVQESLTNARQHAPAAPVRIRLDYRESGLALEIANDPSERGELADLTRGGTGLLGMRERADLVGAAFEAGPTGSGGWRVSLDLPVERTEAERRADDIEFETGERS